MKDIESKVAELMALADAALLSGIPVAVAALSGAACNGEKEQRLIASRSKLESALRTAIESASRLLAPLSEHAIWANDDLMSVNAELGLKMQDIVKIVRAVERAHGIAARPEVPHD